MGGGRRTAVTVSMQRTKGSEVRYLESLKAYSFQSWPRMSCAGPIWKWLREKYPIPFISIFHFFSPSYLFALGIGILTFEEQMDQSRYTAIISNDPLFASSFSSSSLSTPPFKSSELIKERGTYIKQTTK
jgi:hypothetical protein